MPRSKHSNRIKRTFEIFLTRDKDLTSFLYQARNLDYQHYGLRLERNLDKGFRAGIYRDTRTSIAWYKDFPNCESLQASAVLGFTIESGDTIRVRQIQSKKDISERLPIGWPFTLVSAYELWAATRGFKISQIQRAEDNEWYQHDMHPRKERNLRLRRRYDTLAERLDYQFDEQAKVWVKKLDLILPD